MCRRPGRRPVVGVRMDDGAAPPDFDSIVLQTETIFDGGFLPGGSDLIVNELMKDIDELSETEARLRREGAMMVLEKIRLGSIREELPPAELPPAAVVLLPARGSGRTLNPNACAYA